jgi:acyl carrier protein
VSSPPGREYRTVSVDQAASRSAALRGAAPGGRATLDLMQLGTAVSGCALRTVDDADQPLPTARLVTSISAAPMSRRATTVAPPESFTADGWLRTGDLGFQLDGELVVTGRHKELIFSNGENCYPHDLENIAEAGAGIELGKVAVAGARRGAVDEDELLVFMLHRGSLQDFIPLANRVRRCITEQTALQVSHVVPVRAIPKTTSGKIQRGLLARAYEDGEFDDVLKGLDALRLQHHDHGVETESDVQLLLQRIFAGVVTDRRVAIDDDFFDLGISSIALAQIFERIDEEYPGILEIEDLFDMTSIRAIAAHLEQKLAERPG